MENRNGLCLDVAVDEANGRAEREQAVAMVRRAKRRHPVWPTTLAADGGYVAGAFLDPWRFCADPKVSERMFQDLAAKVKLIKALKRMKHERILTVTDSPYVNVTYGDVRKNMPPDYNEQILGAIEETFGVRVTKIGTKEVARDEDIQHLWRNESREANEILLRLEQNPERAEA